MRKANFRRDNYFGSLSIQQAPVYADTTQAMTSICSLSIRSTDFRSILDQHPEVAIKVLDVVSQRLHAAHERVFLLSSAPVENRVAAVLLQLAKKTG